MLSKLEVKNAKSLSFPNVKFTLLKLRATQLTLAGPWEFPAAGFSLLIHRLHCSPSMFWGIPRAALFISTLTVYSIRAVLGNHQAFC